MTTSARVCPPGMYHAKHAEAGGKAGARRRRPAKGGATGGGEFLGFDEDSSNSDVEVGEKRERVRTDRVAGDTARFVVVLVSL